MAGRSEGGRWRREGQKRETASTESISGGEDKASE